MACDRARFSTGRRLTKMNCCSRLPRVQVGREARPATEKPPFSFSKRARCSLKASPNRSRTRSGNERAGVRSSSTVRPSRTSQRMSQLATARVVTIRTMARFSAWAVFMNLRRAGVL